MLIEPARLSLRDVRWVVLPLLVYAVLRLPTLIHAPGGQDEQWFAVPGYTVLREGIPRIPYVPTRNRDTFFENADVCLFALPPALFYVQAPFFAIFPPGYPTARVPLFLGALATIALVYVAARKLGATERSATAAALVMAIARPLIFTGLMTRPDGLCALAGIISIGLLWRYLRRRDRTSLLAGGVACGVAALFHPFALVFAIQAGVALVWSGSWRRRAVSLIGFGLACGFTVGLWMPLIFAFPDEFRSQFFSNVVDRAGPGLTSRLVWPWSSLSHHAVLLWEFLGPFQIAWFAVLALFGTAAAWRRPATRPLVWLVGSSVYLTAVVVGLHPTKGYWVYPVFWVAVTLAVVLDRIAERDFQSGIGALPRRRALTVLVAIALLLPGGGLRTTAIYYAHWGDREYHGGRFIADVLDELPRDGLFFADLSYVFDVYLSGRETRLCQERRQYWGDGPINYRGLLLAWEGEDAKWAEQYDAEHVVRFGSRENDQRCFVDWYVPR